MLLSFFIILTIPLPPNNSKYKTYFTRMLAGVHSSWSLKEFDDKNSVFVARTKNPKTLRLEFVSASLYRRLWLSTLLLNSSTTQT